MLASPYEKYRQSEVQNASPEKLLFMLYGGAIKFLGQAREGIKKKDFEAANTGIGRAQDIICELMVCLNLDHGDIPENLYRLYDYMNNRLIEANIKKDADIITEVEGMIRELRETWKTALSQASL